MKKEVGEVSSIVSIGRINSLIFNYLFLHHYYSLLHFSRENCQWALTTLSAFQALAYVIGGHHVVDRGNLLFFTPSLSLECVFPPLFS